LNLDPGSSIGYHKHDREEEVFVILKGTAEVDDDGSKKILNQGDSILTGNGAGHSIRNIGKEPLEVLAVISSYQQ
jgi:mannose-6-phosphate isomerase-like protein (cupin superfamily)